MFRTHPRTLNDPRPAVRAPVDGSGRGLVRRAIVAGLFALLAAGCAERPQEAAPDRGIRSVARARSPMAISGCFDLHVGEWDRDAAPGRPHFLLPPSILLRFNPRTDSLVNDNYRLEPSVRRGGTLHRGRWVYQTGGTDSLKMLWSDGREGVLILSEPLSNEAITGVAFATFGGDDEPTARAPISMLRKECEVGGRF